MEQKGQIDTKERVFASTFYVKIFQELLNEKIITPTQKQQCIDYIYKDAVGTIKYRLRKNKRSVLSNMPKKYAWIVTVFSRKIRNIEEQQLITPRQIAQILDYCQKKLWNKD